MCLLFVVVFCFCFILSFFVCLFVLITAVCIQHVTGSISDWMARSEADLKKSFVHGFSGMLSLTIPIGKWGKGDAEARNVRHVSKQVTVVGSWGQLGWGALADGRTCLRVLPLSGKEAELFISSFHIHFG